MLSPRRLRGCRISDSSVVETGYLRDSCDTGQDRRRFATRDPRIVEHEAVAVADARACARKLSAASKAVRG
jgi:hypothetical protein